MRHNVRLVILHRVRSNILTASVTCVMSRIVRLVVRIITARLVCLDMQLLMGPASYHHATKHAIAQDGFNQK